MAWQSSPGFSPAGLCHRLRRLPASFRPARESRSQVPGVAVRQGGPQPGVVESSTPEAVSALQSQPASPLAPDDAAGPLLIQVETRLGGLFYLVNLGLYLGLYRDFTTPLQPGLALNLWDFLTLVGQQLLAGAYGDDPAWALLARLAGRDAEAAPGQDFVPPEAWRLPVDWLEGPAFDDHRPWTWGTASGRLRVDHPLGFCILDIPMEAGDPQAKLEDELRPYQPWVKAINIERGSHSGTAGTPLIRWLDWLVGYIRVRLVALGERPLGSTRDRKGV